MTTKGSGAKLLFVHHSFLFGSRDRGEGESDGVGVLRVVGWLAG